MVRSWWQNKPVPGRWLAVILIGGAFLLTDASSYVGGLTDAYLRPPVGAEAQALGNTNITSPAYMMSMINPAASSELSMGSGRISFGGGMRALGRADGNLSMDFRVLSRLGLGVAILYRGDPSITIMDAQEEKVGEAAYTTVTSKVSLSYPISRHLAVGAGLGMYYQNVPASDDPYGFSEEDGPVEYSYAFSIGGIDLGLRYQWRKDITFAAVVQNLLARNDWQFKRYDLGDLQQTSSSAYPVALMLASTVQRELQGRPFIWHASLKSYLLNELSFEGYDRLQRVSALLSNGFEWRYWDNITLRAALSDIPLDTDIFTDFQTYSDNFSAGLGFGAAIDLVKVHPGLSVDYALSLNKILAGVEQQINIVYSFQSTKRSLR